jgi:hypothetical protein
MKRYAEGDRRSSMVRKAVKKHSKKSRKKAIEKAYRRVFSPFPPPHGRQYADEDSLEQPSALRYLPSTTRTTVEMAIDPQMRRDAKLARDF